MQLEDYFTFEKFENCDRIRVNGTRVDIEIIIEEFKRGVSPEEIQQSYPTVTLEQVYATITYYLHNQAVVDDYIRRGEEVAEANYQEWRRTHKPSPLEERLRTVRAASQASKQGAP